VLRTIDRPAPRARDEQVGIATRLAGHVLPPARPGLELALLPTGRAAPARPLVHDELRQGTDITAVAASRARRPGFPQPQRQRGLATTLGIEYAALVFDAHAVPSFFALVVDVKSVFGLVAFFDRLLEVVIAFVVVRREAALAIRRTSVVTIADDRAAGHGFAFHGLKRKSRFLPLSQLLT